jgi:DNA polymerase-3 subunit beta
VEDGAEGEGSAVKFTTLPEHLLGPLQLVGGSIEKRHTLEILSNVRLSLEDRDGGELTFTGTDLETQLITQATVEEQRPGTITVPHRKLLDLVRQLPDGQPVSVDVTDDRMTLRCGKSRFNLACLPAENFPAFEDAGWTTELSIHEASLKRAMARTLYAMANNDHRKYLNGLALEIEGALLTVMASDGHRLALVDHVQESGGTDSRQLILPRRPAQELYKLLDDENRPVQLRIAAHQIQVQTELWTYSSKLIDARVPNFRKPIPKEIDREIRIDRDAFRAALSRVSLMSAEKDKFRAVHLEIAPGAMKMSAESATGENAQDEIPIEYSGDEFSASFNATYLIEAAGNIDTPQLRWGFSESYSGSLITDLEDSSYMHLVMPIKD